ncbi:MAG TPA: type VII secretion protein EccB [Pseudonocardiaceae bacterium]|nr:type VII secretion protein EccB [Pseudonocardiaceae bacterium]
MSTDPPTTSQVQAYRFVVRRMESALVRRDAVMLHEPMRRHMRATAAGVILGMFGLVAFFVAGKFRPVSELSANEIIVGRPSQEIYVVQDNPRRLIPVRNLTSARLLLAAISPGQQAPEAKTVEDSALAGVSRTQSTGIDGVPSLPAPENMIKSVWSVCDTAKIRPDLPNAPDSPNAQSLPQLSTTVLVQERAPAGRVLGDETALLTVEENTGITYLVWRGQRERVDLVHDAAVRTYYRLSNVVPRKVSAGLLNAIPEGHPVTLPAIPVQVLSILTMAEAPVTCVTWRGADRIPAVSIYPDGRLPAGAGDNPVQLPTAATGQTADFAFLPPGKGALARGVVPGQRPDTGAIWLVTAQGFRYGVPSSEVARALGLGEVTSPAPESILNLLPIGPTLDPRHALELYNPTPAQRADR